MTNARTFLARQMFFGAQYIQNVENRSFDYAPHWARASAFEFTSSIETARLRAVLTEKGLPFFQIQHSKAKGVCQILIGNVMDL